MMVGSEQAWSKSSSSSWVAWSREEDKVFERALVAFPEGMGWSRWEKIAERIPGKSPGEVRAHYETLVQDVKEIDAGRVQLPSYPDEEEAAGIEWEAAEEARQISFGAAARGGRGGEGERKKGTPWTEEEHRLFLDGLQKYGKGDWRSISRNVVVSRTPTQVASHAQKFFLRQNSIKKDRKRSSIHDITTTVDTQPIPPPSHFPNQGGSMGYPNFKYPM